MIDYANICALSFLYISRSIWMINHDTSLHSRYKAHNFKKNLNSSCSKLVKIKSILFYLFLVSSKNPHIRQTNTCALMTFNLT